MKNAALGFRAHSGWAAYVAMAGEAKSPEVVGRGRIALADPRIPPPFQPYHKAAEMPLKKAEEYIRRVTKQTEDFAREGIERIVSEFQERKVKVRVCAVLSGSAQKLVDLEKILGAHPLIHTAEGQLFRQAILLASERCGLRAVGVVERDLFARAESMLGLTRKEIDRRLAEWGRALGPPWQQDQKFAALAAWQAL